MHKICQLLLSEDKENCVLGLQILIHRFSLLRIIKFIRYIRAYYNIHLWVMGYNLWKGHDISNEEISEYEYFTFTREHPDGTFGFWIESFKLSVTKEEIKDYD